MSEPNDPRALVARLAGLVAMEAKSPEVIEMAGAIAAAAREPSAAAPSPAPTPADDVETVRRALHDAVYSEDGCDGRVGCEALAALDRLASRLAAQDDRLARFEALALTEAERAKAWCGDVIVPDSPQAITRALAARRREGR